MNDFITRIPSALLAVSIGLLVTYLPGLAILNRFAALRKIDAVSRLFIAPGVSLALYVLLFAFCYKLNITLGWWTPWAITVFSLLALLYRMPRVSRLHLSAQTSAYVVLVIAAIVILLTRLSAINGLVAPMWDDSVHHTIIVQLMLDHGGLFSSWQPYAEATTFTYHIGFHVLTVMYAWMRGMSAEFSVLMMGQIANFAAVMSTYALARLWTKSPWGGVVAVIIGGLVSFTPYYFVFWGRYTQLAGQIILIAALVLISHYLDSRPQRSNRSYLLALPIVIAGLGIAQYKVGVLFVAFCLPLVLFTAVRWYGRLHDLRHALVLSIGRALVIAGIAVLLFMARGFDIAQSKLGTGVVRKVVTEMDSSAPVEGRKEPLVLWLGEMGFRDNAIPVWLAALAGFGILAVKRRKGLWFAAGMALCIVTTDPYIAGIKRSGLVDEFHLSLTVYIAAAGLVGTATGALMEWLSRWKVSQAAAVMASLALMLYGVGQLPQAQQGSIFVLPDDIQMMGWIRQNVPAGALIAGAGSIWYGNFVLGRDAASWILYYTGHHTNQMLLAAGQELDNATREQGREFTFTSALYKRDMSTPDSAAWMAAQGYRYFYIGAKPLDWKDADGDADHAALFDQLRRNPSLKVLHQEGTALLLGMTP
jgi:hypothetical protein